MAEKPLAKSIDNKLCLGTAELCEILDINSDTLNYWHKQGCPKAKRGWWPVADVLKWRGLVGSGPRTEEEAEELGAKQKKLHSEADLKKIQSQLLELKLKEASGELIKKSEIQEELDRFFSVFKKSLTGIPRKISVEVGPFTDGPTARRIERQITELLDDALEQLAENGVYEPPKKKFVKG